MKTVTSATAQGPFTLYLIRDGFEIRKQMFSITEPMNMSLPMIHAPVAGVGMMGDAWR